MPLPPLECLRLMASHFIFIATSPAQTATFFQQLSTSKYSESPVHVVSDIDFIIITGNILCLVNKTGSIVIRNIVILGFYPVHFTITFNGQMILDGYTGNIVIPKIVKSGFHCIMTSASLGHLLIGTSLLRHSLTLNFRHVQRSRPL